MKLEEKKQRYSNACARKAAASLDIAKHERAAAVARRLYDEARDEADKWKREIVEDEAPGNLPAEPTREF